MSPVEWFAVLVAVWWIGFILAVLIGRLERRRYGSFVAREEVAAAQMGDAAILIRACTGFLQDLDFERRKRVAVALDHPVVPPDSLPDDSERSVA